MTDEDERPNFMFGEIEVLGEADTDTQYLRMALVEHLLPYYRGDNVNGLIKYARSLEHYVLWGDDEDA